MIRKNHVGFLGEEAVVTPSPYPANGRYSEVSVIPSQGTFRTRISPSWSA
jgi:hypothetical protein